MLIRQNMGNIAWDPSYPSPFGSILWYYEYPLAIQRWLLRQTWSCSMTAFHLKSGSPDSNQQQEVVAQWCLRNRRKMMKQAEMELRTQMGPRHRGDGSMRFVYILCLCMCVCMYVRTYVRMYVCMYVCINVCMYVHMYVSIFCPSWAYIRILFYGARNTVHVVSNPCCAH